MRKSNSSLKQALWPATLILLMAAYLRCADLGGNQMGTDSAVISLRAIDIARHGQWPLIGPVMSVGFWHSPLSFYLYALPYWLSFDPRIASLFTTGLNLIAMALLGQIGWRYFGRGATLIALVLYATLPQLVGDGRDIWNPLLGAPFVMLYVLTGLMGYYSNRAWARMVHLPALCLAIQCHPGAALLLPVTALLILDALHRRPTQWFKVIGQTFLSGLLTALLALPWGVGLYLASKSASAQTAVAALPNRGWTYTFQTIYEALGYWHITWTQPLLPLVVLIGSVWLLVRAFRRRDGLPGAVVVLGFWLVPLLALVVDAKYRPYYMTSSFPLATLIAGALIGGVQLRGLVTGPLAAVWNWRGLVTTPYVRWAVPPLVSLLVGLHLIYNFTPSESYLGPHYTLQGQIDAIRAGASLAAQSGRDLLILASDSGDEPPYLWELLNAGGQGRVIWHTWPLPVTDKGNVLIGLADDDSRPDLFTGGQLFNLYFRIAQLEPASTFKPDWLAVSPVRFSNGSAVTGFFTKPAQTLPVAGQSWTVYLQAQVESPNLADQTFFVHLVNAAGDKYAQADVPALPGNDQRAGETQLVQFKLQLGQGLPASGPLYLRFGMYGTEGQAKTLDAQNNPIGDFGLIQIRGAAQPAVPDPQGLALDTFSVVTPILQGPPLDVTATWQVNDLLKADLHLRWRLRDEAGQLAVEGQDEILPGTPTPQFPAGAFLTQHYHWRIPTDLAPKTYMLELASVDAQGRDYWSTEYRTPVQIQARPRQFTAPTITQSVQAVFGDQIRLLGYDLSQQAKTTQLTLYWQPQTAIAHDYKYFVHVWQNGQVVAQVDSAPAQYQYLTSWWAVGEVVTEPVTLDLSNLGAGDYTLTTGFYDPDTGERLPVRLADGTQLADQWVTLQTLQLP